jgi:hypothetical protein
MAASFPNRGSEMDEETMQSVRQDIRERLAEERV